MRIVNQVPEDYCVSILDYDNNVIEMGTDVILDWVRNDDWESIADFIEDDTPNNLRDTLKCIGEYVLAYAFGVNNLGMMTVDRIGTSAVNAYYDSIKNGDDSAEAIENMVKKYQEQSEKALANA